MTDGQHQTDVDQQSAATLEKEIAEALGEQSVMDLVDQPDPTAPADPAIAPGDHTMAKGKIVAVHDEDVFVDLGGKSQGILPLNQFESPPELGTEMDFVVEGVLGDEGLIKLSRKGAVEKATWQTLQRGMIVEGTVSGSNTGGLELKIAGQRAFMPASHIDLVRVEKFNEYLGQKMQCQVIELDKRAKRIIVSRRAVLAEEQKAAREKVLEQIQVGDQREGQVRNIQQFGAFVDLGGIDGLVHITDLSYERVNKVEDVVKVGDTVRVKVLKIENGGERISLGMKQVGPNPWDAVEHKYTPGDVLTGRVTRLMHFGAFIEVEPGVEGLVPMSELSWDRIANASQVVKAGDTVSAKVLEVNAKKHRISLSLKQMSEDPWAGVEGEFPADSDVEGTVTRIAEFGAFVELKPGVDGLIHISELSDKRVDSVESAVKVGQTVKAKVLGVEPQKKRISLSIKALIAPDPDRAPRGKASRDDMKKYVVSESKKASSGESLGALMDKFGGPGGGLKGGLG